MNGNTQIYVSGREYKVPGPLVTYEQVVKIWNELHEPENKHIIGHARHRLRKRPQR